MLLPLVLVLQLCDVPVSSLSDTALSQGEGGQGQKQRLCRMVRSGRRQNTVGGGRDFTEEEASVPHWTPSETDFSPVIEIK